MSDRESVGEGGAKFDPSFWARGSSKLLRHIEEENERTLAAYEAKPLSVFEHANIERATAQGGYGRRQLFELIQNGADALVGTRRGRIHVVLTEDALYCANEGEPIDSDGADALLMSHISRKRGAEIGRFGLGFKSVLGVTDCPEFFSWSGSFRFDADWCQKEILKRIPNLADINEDGRTPTLRLAAPVDPTEAAADDPVLRELMSWATTVVKLPLARKAKKERDWLAGDLEKFPKEFMLFSPHVAGLRLEDRISLLDRRIGVSVDGGIYRLAEGQTESLWRVFLEPQYRPTATALEDAGELAHRETVPVIWAVPMNGQDRQRRGRFWAFFPTEYETTLSGIINAPWKTNEDRQNLLPGAFNDELVGVVVDLIIDNLDKIVDPEDPGSYLELLPARGREAPSPTDRLLTDLFFERAAAMESLPDQRGVLRVPDTIRLHPNEATARSLEHWSSYPDRPTDWCHRSVFQRDRRACAERLLESEGTSVLEWLEALVEDGTPQASMAAIRAAAALADRSEGLPDDVRLSEIVLTSGSQLVSPDPAQVFIPSEHGVAPGDVKFVHLDLVADPETMAALERLGISRPDGVAGLRALLTGGLSASTNWDAFWTATRGIVVGDSAPIITQALHRPGTRMGPKAGLHVKVMGGSWRPLHATLLPGAIVPADEPGDDEVVIDTEYHAEDLELLERLGARSGPVPGGGTMIEPWFREYRNQVLQEYYESLETGERPREDYLEFDKKTFVGPLSALRRLGPVGKARLTAAVVRGFGDQEPEWKLRHTTRRAYPVRRFVSPAVWFLRGDGYLYTSLGPVSVDEAVGPELKRWSAFLPVAREDADPLDIFDLPASLEQVAAEQWQAALERAEIADVPAERLGSFYVAASRCCETPERIRCQVGDTQELRSPGEVTSVSSREHFDTLRQDAIPVLLLENEDEAQTIVEEWGLRRASDVVRTTYNVVPTALGSTIASRFPALAVIDDEIGDITLQPCESILAVTYTDLGRVTEERVFAVDGETALFRQDLSDSDLLIRISDHFGLGLEPTEIDSLVDAVRDDERRHLMREIANEPDDAARLSRLLGEDTIARRLPKGLREALDARGLRDGHSIALAALAVYGVAVLRDYRDDLVKGGWDPPAAWAGGRDASAFVRALGFDAMYAGQERRARPPFERVDGPALLPPMHEFQARIADTARELFRTGVTERALLSLPTGAGKTRIAVQSIIEALRDGDLSGPILWIAQTEELCEQAVETWSFVWRAIGPQRSLHISRLWGSFEAEPVEGPVQVVVTTIAKMLNRVEDSDYEWLSKTDCVIVDEAHGSTTPSYTKVLNWLGIRGNRQRIPLVGLTATPFRGTSSEQTQRLVRRYGSRRLDHGVFDGVDPYAYLQKLGVLAEVDHRMLAGYDIVLTDKELDELQKMRRLPSKVGERIGANRERNDTIIEEVLDFPDDWPVLLFAASVDHAQTLAALLTLEGIPSAAVTGQTDHHVRRHYIERFRSGEIRVLTNYNVLTQGFDAPATRAVIVARPTFSANLYQQMIGRGLRGPLNGGKERCLIVNVEDNVLEYGEQLAFYDFEYLWDGSGGEL